MEKYFITPITFLDRREILAVLIDLALKEGLAPTIKDDWFSVDANPEEISELKNSYINWMETDSRGMLVMIVIMDSKENVEYIFLEGEDF